MSREIIILKLGGSVITKKSEGKKEVNEKNLKRLAKEIFYVKKKKKKNLSLVIVHGAGHFGHTIAKEYELNKGFKDERQIEGMIKTHQSMENLNFKVVKILQDVGLNAISFQPSSTGILKNKKLIFFPTKVIKEFLKLDLIPVLYGDVLIDKKTRINILSGDHLVPYLAKKLNADRVILCTDVDGVFDLDPKKNKDAKLISFLSKKNLYKIKLGRSKSTDVTGGMKRKVQELLDIAKKGIKSNIINGFKPGLLKKALLNENRLGTTIKTH